MKASIISLSSSIFALTLVFQGHTANAALDCAAMGALQSCMLPGDTLNNPTGQFVVRRRYVNGVNQVQSQTLCIKKAWGTSDDRCGCAGSCPQTCNQLCLNPEGGAAGDMGVFIYDSSNGDRRCVTAGRSLQMKQQNPVKWVCSPPRRNLRSRQQQGENVAIDHQLVANGESTENTPVSRHLSTFTNTYRMTMTLTINIAAVGKRAATKQENDGAMKATTNWLMDQTKEIFPSNDKYEASRITATIDHASFNPTLDAKKRQRPYQMVLKVELTWSANAQPDIPTINEYFTVVAGKFNRLAYIQKYLKAAMPSDSLYRSTSGIGIVGHS